MIPAVATFVFVVVAVVGRSVRFVVVCTVVLFVVAGFVGNIVAAVALRVGVNSSGNKLLTSKGSESK